MEWYWILAISLVAYLVIASATAGILYRLFYHDCVWLTEHDFKIFGVFWPIVLVVVPFALVCHFVYILFKGE